MAKNQNGSANNGKIAASKTREAATAVDGSTQHDNSFVRSSHSLSTRLAKQLRALAYEQQTSESQNIERELWLFFRNGSDTNGLRLLGRPGVAHRGQKS